MSATRRLLSLIRPFIWWIAAGVMLGFATIGSSVGLMAVSAYLISKAAIATDVSQLSLAIAGVRLFAISRAAFRYGERYVTHLATFRILTRLRVWIYSAIEPLAPARLQGVRSGDLLARIGADIETLENFYIRVIVPPLVAVLVTGLACAILGTFDAVLAWALLLFLLLTGVLLPLVSRWLSRQPAGEAVLARAELNATLVDQIQGMADMLAYGQEAAYRERTLRLNDQINRLQGRLAVIRGMGNGLAALFTSLAALTVLFLAIPLVSSGQIDGVFLALIPLTAIASFEAVQPLAQAFQVLESSQAAASRLFELIDAPPAVSDPPEPAAQPQRFDLVVEDLRFRYAADEPAALDGVSFTLPAGGRLGIVGASGAGKSTLANLLLRFWDYGEGSIRLGGAELRDLAEDEARAGRRRRAAHPPLQHQRARTTCSWPTSRPARRRWLRPASSRTCTTSCSACRRATTR
ncbi:MAG: thiol reductant ABC exporter subunit CydC [Caldilineales bacterium]